MYGNLSRLPRLANDTHCGNLERLPYISSEPKLTNNLTIDALHQLYSSGETRPSEICRAALDRIEKSNERLNTFLKLDRDAAIERAAAMDAEIKSAVQTKPLA